MMETPLEIGLRAFMYAMLQKFRLRADRRRDSGERSVTDKNYDWRDLDLVSIRFHLSEEIDEWLESETDEQKIDEDCDIANMAFLDWIRRKQNEA